MKAYSTALCSALVIAFLCGLRPAPPRAPVLTGIKPAQVYPGQIVLVEGSNLGGAQVVWDQMNRGLHQSQLVTNYFQIPHNATQGSHTVQLKNADGISAPVNIFVQALHSSWPAPRIEDIGINSYQVHDGDRVDFYLAVSAANVDPNAQVFVNSTPCPSTFYSALPDDFFSSKAHLPQNYGYPVFHYGMLIVYAANQKFSQTLNIRVNNVDGAFGERDYAIPAQANLDSDGDGLLDDWEDNGYPVSGGTDRISLRDMGCDSHHKDILVQVDWMRSAAPDQTIWPIIDTIFAHAPVLNPDGSGGIRMHIDHGQDALTGGPFREGGKTLADFATIDFCDYPELKGHAVFKTLKDANFPAARTNLFHYCIFGNGRPDGSTGRAEIWGDDFMVTFAVSDPADWANPNAQIGTFIHELGHNLGLFHGGWDLGIADFHERFKWNQRSSMNYRYQLGGVPVDRDNRSGGVTHTYSEGIDTTIIEGKLDRKAMNNAMGVNPSPPKAAAVNYNVNAGPVINGVIENWNPDEKDATDVFINYDEWGSLKLNFNDPRSGKIMQPCINTDAPVICSQVDVFFQDSLASACRGGYRIRLDGTVSMDGGLCAPPGGCGVSFPCVPPGDYFVSALSVCDSNRYYWTATDTVRVPNDTANAQVLHVDTVKTITVHIIVK